MPAPGSRRVQPVQRSASPACDTRPCRCSRQVRARSTAPMRPVWPVRATIRGHRHPSAMVRHLTVRPRVWPTSAASSDPSVHVPAAGRGQTEQGCPGARPCRPARAARPGWSTPRSGTRPTPPGSSPSARQPCAAARARNRNRLRRSRAPCRGCRCPCRVALEALLCLRGPLLRHGEQPDPWHRGRGDLAGSVERAPHRQLHVRLARAQPHVAHQHIARRLPARSVVYLQR